MSIEKIKKIAIKTLQENDVEFAGLFGSFARGEETDQSDVETSAKVQHGFKSARFAPDTFTIPQ